MAGRRDFPTGTFNPAGMVSGLRTRGIFTGDAEVVMMDIFYNSSRVKAIKRNQDEAIYPRR
jgi:hypothetical protein